MENETTKNECNESRLIPQKSNSDLSNYDNYSAQFDKSGYDDSRR